MKKLAAAGAMRLSLYFKKRNLEDVFNEYSGILDSEPSKEKLDEIEDFSAYSTEDVKNFRTLKLISFGNSNGISICLVELALLRYIFPRTSELFDRIASGCGDGVTLEVACLVALDCLDSHDVISDHMPEIVDAYDSLSFIFSSKEETNDLARVVLRADMRLVNFLNGIDVPDVDIMDYVTFEEADYEAPEIFGYSDQVGAFTDKVVSTFDQLDETDTYIPSTVVITGEKESGRTLTVSNIREALGIPVLYAEYELICKNSNPRDILYRFVKECQLMDSALCIRNIVKDENTVEVIKQVRKKADLFGCRPLFLVCDNDVKCVPYLDGRVFTFQVPRSTPDVSIALWKDMLGNSALNAQFDVEGIASRMALTAGQIERVLSLAITEEQSGVKLTENDLFRLCYTALDDGRYENIKRVKSGFSLSDLKTSEQNINTLRDICTEVKERQKVYYQWGMASKYTYGRCVSVILAGPPGTGKTMAVHALSTELGLELYKVDLSQLVDKYIGETEKRLEEVFLKAEKSNMILFFDEADAIMGKRSETKDSKDKYANTEIAYILQRIEEFDGIVILATNYLNNIDPAFMRRIKFIVNMDLPDEDTRREIWQSAFADGVPVSDNIDFDYLASEFKISGGNIKNIVLNASFLAAGEGIPVEMKHILKALYRENTKDKRIAFTSDYGKYGYLTNF